MSAQPSRRLMRAEINLLKHLVRVAPIGFPVTVPRKLRKGILSAWRLGLIEVWYRQILVEMKVPGCEWLPLTEAA